MVAAAFASFFTGVTEPLEFSFMFVAWAIPHPCWIDWFIIDDCGNFPMDGWFHFSAGFIDFL